MRASTIVDSCNSESADQTLCLLEEMGQPASVAVDLGGRTGVVSDVVLHSPVSQRGLGAKVSVVQLPTE